MVRHFHLWQTVCAEFARDFLSMLRFFSRLGVPALAFEHDVHAMPNFKTSVRALPLAGACLGLCGAAIVLTLRGLGLPPSLVAALTLAGLALITGAMHEDGLADVADGFGGGGSLARKLEIMKDSRLGTFGAMALVLTSLARWAALTALMARFGDEAGALALVANGAVSRALCVMPMWLLPPARSDGAGFSAARPSGQAMLINFILAAVISVVAIGFGSVGFKRVVAGLCLAGLSTFLVTEVSRRQIGGQTGDVAGAAQQLAELVFLSALLLGTAL